MMKKSMAVIGGLAISAILALATYATHSPLFFAPQYIGFWLCMLLRGAESANHTDFALIALPTNAAIYAGLIFVLLRYLNRASTAQTVSKGLEPSRSK
jgi:hypothetical protein